MNQTQRNLLLASFLHDIGKYYNFTPGSNHSENSARLIEDITDSIKLSEAEKRIGIDLNRIKSLIKDHHKSSVSDRLLGILQSADRYTAMEREEEDKGKKKDRTSTPLLSTFSTIKFPRSSTFILQERKRYLVGNRISELIKEIEDLKNDVKDISSILIKEHENDTKIMEYYKKENWEKFKGLMIDIFKYSKNFETLLSSIDLVLFDFLKLVPSDITEEEVFIPLYDHLKLSAALSLILSKSSREYSSETTMNSALEQKEKAKEITVISVDIGNIQSFISKSYNYEEARKGLTRRLRGRSYFVSLITELIAEYIVEKLGLTHLNILRSSAGSVLIISNKISDEMKKELKRELEEFIIDELKGDLTISIAFVDYDIDSFFVRESESQQNNKTFRDLLKEISVRIEKEKARRLSSVMDKISKFNNEKIGKNICKVCGNHIGKEKDICDLCEFLEDFGRNIVKNKVILVVKNGKADNLKFIHNYHELKIGKNKYIISVVDVDSLTNNINTIKDEDSYLFIFLNNLPGILSKKNILGATKIRLFVEYSYVPLDENENIFPIEAEETEGEESKETTKRNALLSNVEINIKGKKRVVDFTKLCVVYFDLDNAGKIFSGSRERYEVIHVKSSPPLQLGLETFEIKGMTPSKWVTLSFFTHFFFSVIANRLAKKWNVYVIFSGGDDIKAFGSPYELLNFYFEFVKEFKYYFEGKLTFSGGILLTDKNTPVFNSIRNVEKLESKAKKFEVNGKEIKGCVAFIDDKYIFPIYASDYIKDAFNKLIEIVKIDGEGKISSTSLYNIFRIASQHIETKEEIKKNERIFIGYSRIEYILKRNWDMDDNGWQNFLDEYIKKDVVFIGGKSLNAIKFFVPIFSFFYSTISKIKEVVG